MGKATLTAKEMRKKKENTIKIIVTLVILTAVAAIAIWFVLNKDEKILNDFTSGTIINEKNEENNKSGESEVVLTKPTKYKDVEKNPVVTMEMMSGDIVKIELYPQIAPTTVENFISLINSGFYDGLTFHRLIPDFMAQGGDPSGDGTGGPDYSIKGEFSENGFENNLTHEIGVISMARANDPDSAGSQFFIVTNEQSYMSLDGLYAGFGKVIEGMEHVYTIVNAKTLREDYSAELMNEIEKAGGQITTEELYIKYMTETTEISTPVNPPVIKKMTVDTFGYEYDEPEKL